MKCQCQARLANREMVGMFCAQFHRVTRAQEGYSYPSTWAMLWNCESGQTCSEIPICGELCCYIMKYLRIQIMQQATCSWYALFMSHYVYRLTSLHTNHMAMQQTWAAYAISRPPRQPCLLPTAVS